MSTPPRGTKQQVLGGALAGLSVLVVLLSRTIGFELDPFYVVIGVLGGCLFLHGASRNRTGHKQSVACGAGWPAPPGAGGSQRKRR